MLRNLTHGVVIVLSGFAQVGLGVGRETLRHGCDVRLLAGRRVGGEIHGLLNGFVRLLETVGAGGIVVIGTDGFRNSPVGDGELGIDLGRVLEEG